MSLQQYNDIFSEPFEKQIEIITYGGTVFTNSDICEESLIIEDSLCSEENLMFGACEAKCLKVRVIDKNISLKNQILTVTIKCNLRDTLIDSDGDSIINHDGDVIATTADAETDIKLGVFAVFSAEPSNDRSWIDIVAYDQMYTLLNADLSSWYNQLNFPMTVKQLRDSLFNGLQISQVTTTLVNDSFVVEGGFLVDGQLSGKTVVEAICELNGVFGHFTPDNEFEFIDVTNTESVTLDHYVDGTGIYSSYATNPISKIVARSSEDDVGTSVGSGNNVYILENNPLIFGKEGTPELTAALTNLFNKIKVITFRPFEVETYGNPMLPVGSKIVIPTRDITIYSIVMTKVMRGIQALRDKMSASGDLNYPSTVNNVQSQISRTSGKVHNLRIDVDELTSEMISVQSINKKAIKVYACTSYSTYYPSSDPQDARIRLNVPITDGSFEPLGNSESTKIGVTLPSNFDSIATNERDLKITIGSTEIIAPIYYDGSALTNQIAAKGGDIMYFNLSTDASGNYSADVIMDTTSRSLISQTAEGIELMVSEISGVNVPVYEMTSYNYDSVNDVVTIYATGLPFDSLIDIYNTPHRIGIKLQPMTASEKAAKKEVYLVATSDSGSTVSVTGWIYNSNNNIVTDAFDGDNIIYLEYDERTISGSDTFGFWVVTDTYSQSQIAMTNNQIVMKVDSNGNIGKAAIGVDPDTTLTAFEIDVDSIKFKANSTMDLSAASLSITSQNFSVDTSGNVIARNLKIDPSFYQTGALSIVDNITDNKLGEWGNNFTSARFVFRRLGQTVSYQYASCGFGCYVPYYDGEGGVSGGFTESMNFDEGGLMLKLKTNPFSTVESERTNLFRIYGDQDGYIDIANYTDWLPSNTSLRSSIREMIDLVKAKSFTLNNSDVVQGTALGSHVSLDSGYKFLCWLQPSSDGWVTTFPIYCNNVENSNSSVFFGGTLPSGSGYKIKFTYLEIKDL